MPDSEKSRFPKCAILGRVRILCAIYSFQFNSIQFISFHFISIQRDEKNETLRMITKKTKYYEKKENYEILRKKGKLRNVTKYYEKKENYEILRKKEIL